MPRIFFALPVEPDTYWQSLLQESKKQFKDEAITWVSINGIHITLYFFGEVEMSVIEKIIQEAQKTYNGLSCIELKLLKPVLFTSHRKPSIIGWQFAPHAALIQIHKLTVQLVTSVGFMPSTQNFVPHVTLGRVKKVNAMKTYDNYITQQPPDIPIYINKIVLYKSTLMPQGALYSPLWETSLSKI